MKSIIASARELLSHRKISFRIKLLASAVVDLGENFANAYSWIDQMLYGMDCTHSPECDHCAGVRIANEYEEILKKWMIPTKFKDAKEFGLHLAQSLHDSLSTKESVDLSSDEIEVDSAGFVTRSGLVIADFSQTIKDHKATKERLRELEITATQIDSLNELVTQVQKKNGKLQEENDGLWDLLTSIQAENDKLKAERKIPTIPELTALNEHFRAAVKICDGLLQFKNGS